MSEIKSNKISPRKGTTTTIGDSGDSVTISSGTTTTNAGTISTAGITGGTINNTTGTITGLQQVINWQTGDIKTASFTASANEGYFLNTTSGQITVTLPASPTAGDVVAVKDYADTFDTNKAILNANGNKIQGSTTNFDITVEGTAAILLYVDSTKGWLLVDQSKAADISEQQLFVTATGGTITTSGNFKIHTFTGPGTFCVSCAGNPIGSNTVDYLVVAGGGAGGSQGNNSGGGGAGGYRESSGAASGCYTRSPLGACVSALPVSAQPYPITVGSGGAYSPGFDGSCGANSIFSTITSTGGGGGGAGDRPDYISGNTGGSGGGNAYNKPQSCRVAGNTPPVSPPQGNPGGAGNCGPGGGSPFGSGGGGGATAAGADGRGTMNGGAGATSSINGTPTTRGGGGGGTNESSGGSGGSGGGGAGSIGNGGTPGQNGSANTGGGGGGGNDTPSGGSGGSGIVIIRYKFQ